MLRDIKIISNTSSQEMWIKIRNRFEEEFGQDIFSKWLSKLELYSFGNDEVIMSVSSKFIRDWIKREYLNSGIGNIWRTEVPAIKRVSIIHIQDSQSNSDEHAFPTKENKVINLSKYDNIFTLGTELNDKFTFDNFVEGKSNKLACRAAKIISGQENDLFKGVDINPLFLHGGVGLGKTHLGQAIAWHIKENDKKSKVVYLSAERFMHQFVQSLRNKDIAEFKDQFRSIDLLIIDDLQFISGKDGTQEQLLYTIASLVEDNKKVVLICDRCPGDLNNIGEKLKSRISAGMVVDFKCPDYETRLRILQSKAKVLEVDIKDEILQLLATKISSNVRDLEGALKKLVVNYFLTDEIITIDSANLLLQDLFRTTGKITTIGDIKKQVATYFNIKVSDLSSSSRSRDVTRPRQIAMYLAKSITTKSLPVIGDAFGGKGHATVIHAIKTVEKLMGQDAEFACNVCNIQEAL